MALLSLRHMEEDEKELEERREGGETAILPLLCQLLRKRMSAPIRHRSTVHYDC